MRWACRVDLNRHIDDGHRPPARLRERISERIDAKATIDASALITALAVGDTARIARAVASTKRHRHDTSRSNFGNARHAVRGHHVAPCGGCGGKVA